VVTELSKQQGQIKQQQVEHQRNISRMNQQIASAIRREIEEARRKAEEEARRKQAAEEARAKAENRAVEPSTVKRITKTSTTSEVLNATPEAAKLSKRLFRQQRPPAMAGNQWRCNAGFWDVYGRRYP
jgi:membrane protein involved in colicin uptake